MTDYPNGMCETTSNMISDSMQRFIPSKNLETRITDHSWWTSECAKATRAKQRRFQAFKNNRTSKLVRCAYKSATKRLRYCIQKAKHAEEISIKAKLCNKRGMRDKEWWATVKKAGGLSHGCSIPSVVCEKGDECASNQAKADEFANFNSEKCSLGSEDFQAGEELPDVQQRTTDKISRVRFSVGEVRSRLKRLDPSIATGPDQIPARVLKMVTGHFAARHLAAGHFAAGHFAAGHFAGRTFRR